MQIDRQTGKVLGYVDAAGGRHNRQSHAGGRTPCRSPARHCFVIQERFERVTP